MTMPREIKTDGKVTMRVYTADEWEYYNSFPYEKEAGGAHRHTNPISPTCSGTGLNRQGKTPRDLRTNLD